MNVLSNILIGFALFFLVVFGVGGLFAFGNQCNDPIICFSNRMNMVIGLLIAQCSILLAIYLKRND